MKSLTKDQISKRRRYLTTEVYLKHISKTERKKLIERIKNLTIILLRPNNISVKQLKLRLQ